MGGTGSLGCYRHPDRATGIACARCGRPICPECMVPASVGFQCPECVREGNASVRTARGGSGLQAAGRRWGPVTLTLIAINVAMFLVTAVSAAFSGSSPLDNYQSPVFDALSQWPYGVSLFGEWWRVFTGAFLHIGPLHLVMNMLGLLIFGSEIEKGVGRWRFLALYLISVLGGAVSIQLFGDPRVPVAGASTAIYGLLGALGVLMIANRQDLRGLLTLLGINIAISFLPGISLLGHLGGLVAGALAAALLVLTRNRQPVVQAVALTSLGVLLAAVALTVSTVAVLSL